MSFAETAGSFAAAAIMTLFWWTVLSPLVLLAVAVICATRPRTRAVLTLVTLAPPIVALLPLAAMHGGATRAAAIGGVMLEGAGIALAAAAHASARRRPEGAARYATAALVCGVTGGMLGSGALVLGLIVV